jgi:hypothetical protein
MWPSLSGVWGAFLRKEPNEKGEMDPFEINPFVSLPNQAISVPGTRTVWQENVHFHTRKQYSVNGARETPRSLS